MSDNIAKVKPQDCCGCGACYNKCPVGAISMQENEEGFLTPVIDEAKCTNCGLCLKACPSLNTEFKNNPQPECYAAMADDELRMKSSSGGIFTLLAEYILDKGGYVCGAAFDNNWDVHHIIVDNKEDLAKLRGSKYVQSNTEDCYKQIKKLLDDDKYVLFSGCPCQVAALYSFLGKEYEKLYTMDLVCHGAPSPKIWQQYLNEYDRTEIKNIDFRDKAVFGWSTTMNIYMKNNCDIHLPPKKDSYYRAFLNNYSLRISCGNCHYAKIPRVGDITLGDFWGIEKSFPNLNDKKGTSLILVNNEKGKSIFNQLTFKLLTSIPIKYAINSPNYPLSKSSPFNKKRKEFFDLASKHTVTDSINYVTGEKYDVAVLNYARYTNYGGILTAYAVQRTISKLGYVTKTIDFVCDSIYNIRKKNNFTYKGKILIADGFKKYFDLTEECHNYQDLKNLNHKADTFIVGSDQVWRHGGEHLWQWNVLPFIRYRGVYFLSFADNCKKLISCSASFGVDEFEGNEIITTLTKHFLKRFDYISVREESGVDICKNVFDVNATHTIEPVFLLEEKDWNNFINDSTIELPKNKYIAYYFLDKTPQKVKMLEAIKEDLQMEAIDLSADLTRPVVDFVKYIANSEFVVTDSFHGCCFSVIFKKKFAGILNNGRGATRFKSLFPKIKLDNRILTSVEDFKVKKDLLYSEIDYDSVYKEINKDIEYTRNWLINALKSPKVRHYSESEKYISTYFNELENELSGLTLQVIKLKKQIKKLDKIDKLEILARKDYIYRKYYRYKWLAKLLPGKKRKHYQDKALIFHEKVREIRRLEKEAELC